MDSQTLKNRQTLDTLSSERQDDPPMSAADALHRRIVVLGAWLASQGLDLDPESDRAHIDEGSRDRLYFHYGYFAGLKKALATLTASDGTIH